MQAELRDLTRVIRLHLTYTECPTKYLLNLWWILLAYFERKMLCQHRLGSEPLSSYVLMYGVHCHIMYILQLLSEMTCGYTQTCSFLQNNTRCFPHALIIISHGSSTVHDTLWASTPSCTTPRTLSPSGIPLPRM